MAAKHRAARHLNGSSIMKENGIKHHHQRNIVNQRHLSVAAWRRKRKAMAAASA